MTSKHALQRTYSIKFINLVVGDILTNNLTLREASEKYEVPFTTVAGWMSRRGYYAYQFKTIWRHESET